ncbi:variant SH3 domain-containing protein [Ditylenchus destructor]|nr:variant SH3 domain-containing protein [Ditylenchus destructor]
MFLPNELLTDISTFVPDDDVKNLVLLSRAFATVTAKRLPIISVKNKILSKFRRAQWPPVRIMMAKHNYDARWHSPNVDWEETKLSFCSGDLITVYGEMDEDGFYFGELNGVRGLVPSNFLDPTIPNTTALLPPEAKALIYSFYQYEFYPYMAAQNHIVPTKILSDISNFIPDGDVKNLGFVSRSFAYVITKRCAIIKAKNKILLKARRAQWPRARIMIAKWDYNPRVLSRNVDGEKYELSFCSGDRITIFSDVDEDGFYLGELNGARGKVPSNFLEPADPNTPRVLISPQAKAWIFSFYPYMAARNRVCASEIISDISNFIPNHDMKKLGFLSRPFAAVITKKLPIIKAKNNILLKIRQAQCPTVRTMMAKWDYDARRLSPNVDGEQNELSFCSGDKITVYGEMDEDGFYLGELNGARGLVPSNFLDPTILNTPNTLMPSPAKASSQSHSRHSGLSNRYTNHKTQESRPKIMIAKWDYDPRHLSPNVDGEQVELSFCSGDLITVYGEMDEDGFYFGELNGVRGLVPSNFLHPTILSTPNALMPPQAKASAQSHSRHSGPSNRYTNHKTQESRPKGMAFSEARAKSESAEATAPSKKMSQSSVASLVKRWELLTTSGVASPVKTNIPSGEASPGYKNNCVTLPNEVLSDISAFLPNDDVEDLAFLSRAFAAVTAKRFPVINEKYRSPFERHIDVDKLLEDYAWRMFDLARQKKDSDLKKFKDMEKEEAAFNINRNRLSLVHDDPIYRNVQQTEQRKSTSETQTRGINLGVTVILPAGGQIEASLISEVVSYSGHYTLVSTLSGEVTVNITRAGVLIHQVTFNVATAFQQYLAKLKPRFKRVVSMDHGKVKLTSKGTCHFQFDLKHYSELSDVKHRKQATASKQTFLGTNVSSGGSSAIGVNAPTAGGYAASSYIKKSAKDRKENKL